jgi:hypothetical protein
VTKQKCKGRLTEIAAADLPAAIATYLSLHKLRRLPKCSLRAKMLSGQIVVGLKLADGTHKGLLFNADGTFNKALEKYHKGS